MQPAPVVILVHGAWHGPWVWTEVRRRLEAAGVSTQAVDLPSAGGDTASLGDLHDDAEVVRAAVAGVGGPTVVVAHSYGALPVTEGVAGSDNVAHLVYLAAFMIEPRESLLGLRGGVEPDWWRTSGDGRTLLPDNPKQIFFNDCEPDVAERSAAALVPQRKDVFRQEILAAAWQHVPSTYVVCARDNALGPALQEQMAERAGAVRRIDSGHSAFLSRPDEVTAVIRETLAGAA
jgi:pimeloyl-ACP methyl ester carboxylesterase